jgi:hypothetical protein
MSATNVRKYQCRKCGRPVPGPAVRWFAYGFYDRMPCLDDQVTPLIPLCEGCEGLMREVIEACLDGADGEGDE